MTTRLVLAVLFAASMPAAAQMSPVRGLDASYGFAKSNLIKAAEQMPTEHYGFKPTPAVRSFGEIVGHVANANYMICSTAMGEQSPSSTDFEKTADKAALVKAITESFGYCDKAMQLADAKAGEAVNLFGMSTNRLGVLSFNISHDFEHYGNLVTYLRLKGLVPPSSQQ